MEYNTSRKKLVLPEYGRNIQRMVDLTKAEPDTEKRNAMAQAIIAIMGNMNPHLRDIVDFKHKLWDHLAIMANYELSYGGKVKLMLDVSLFISRGCLPVISLDEEIE